MLDPRIELSNMIWEMREKLNHIEMKLWEIPHHEEPVQEYEAVFTAPAEGDYLHPATPTHHKPEGFSDAAYWDECCQCWMEPTPYEWDEHNYVCNANCDVSYDSASTEWVEGEDWSNHYADDWYDHGNVEVHHEEVSTEVEMPEPVHTEPVLDADGFVIEDEAPVEPAPETPAEGEMEPAPEVVVEAAPEMEPAPEPAPEMEPEMAPETTEAPEQGDDNPPAV